MDWEPSSAIDPGTADAPGFAGPAVSAATADGPTDPHDSWGASFHAEAGLLLQDLQRRDPASAHRLGEGIAALPSVGSDFLGFKLTAELGRGAFGRVFLARQGELSDRPVALKVSADVLGESRKLARLQHTHIVPVYSVHQAGPLQAVCMPYFGSTTLADVLAELGKRDSLPGSGKDLVSTIQDRKSRTKPGLDSKSASPPSGLAAAPVVPSQLFEPQPPVETGTAVGLETLQGLTYVEAVLWLGARMADGLAHAHDRGIVHRDVKPANVLLTDEGQPMLLDFNLSDDSVAAGAAAARVGGTLPYMAPEHLEAFHGQKRTIDARCDVYGLGVILYELFTRRHPFTRHTGPTELILPRMIEERKQAPPRLRAWNPAVTPAVESIVRHCLEPDPARRYQSARELKEDIERHLSDRPLRHAPEPSFRERAGKFLRRNPSLTSASAVATLAAVLLAGLGVALVLRGQRVARLEAADTLAAFRDDHKKARLLLSVSPGARAEYERGQEIARAAMDRYGVLDDDWESRPAYRYLESDEREQVRSGLAELLLLTATPLARSGEESTPADTARAREGLRLNRLAEGLYGEMAPRTLYEQRASLLRAGGDLEQARQLTEQVKALPSRDAWDEYLLAREKVLNAEFRAAVPKLLQTLKKDPGNIAAYFLLANCQLDGFANSSEAIKTLTTCIILWPEFAPFFANRGLAYLRECDYEKARDDLDRAVELGYRHPELYVNRALARQALKDYDGSLADLHTAREQGADAARVLFMRVKVHRLKGDAEAAKADRDEAMKETPRDEEGWMARGVVRAADEPEGALADFREAVKLNPRSLLGRYNQAHLLSERLNKPKEAVAVLDEVVELYPDYGPAVAGRAVLRARQGQRTEAIRDARAALTKDGSPLILYMAACVFAQTSRQNADDRAEAVVLLGLAVDRGFGADLLATDRDLDPLRRDRKFEALLKAAREARTF